IVCALEAYTKSIKRIEMKNLDMLIIRIK
ncbi:MAG: hypothetical protein RLZZ391_66, partial [Bacteroidota bacterium]